ncbi:MAG: hypothetical protein QXR58_02355 [Candidatus Micrarchaeaceae archaeon]
MEKSEAERKLEEGIDCLLQASEGVSTEGMSEEELFLRKLSDLKFRKQLMKAVSSIIESRRVSELMAESLYGVEYRLSGKISSDEFSTSIEGLLTSQK